MMILNRAKRRCALLAATVLLAGCASNPAPVVNYSYGPNGQPVAGAAPSAPPAAKKPATKTFGLGHANGTVGAGGYTVAPGDTLYSIAFANSMDVRELAALNGLSPPYVIHPGQVLKLKPGEAGVATTTVAPQATSTAVANAPQATSTVVANAPAPKAAPPAEATASGAPVFGPVTQQQMTATGVAAAPAAASEASPAPAVTSTATAPVAAAASAAAPAPAPVVAPPAAAVSAPTPPPGATRNVAGITWQWPASGKVISGFGAGTGGEGAGLNIAGNMGDPVRAAAAGTVVYSGDGLPGYGALIIIKHNDTYLSAYGHNSKRLVQEGQHVSAGQEIALMGASGAARVELHFEIRKDGKPVDPLSYLPSK